MQVSEAYVRQVIHDFNERGLDALDPKWSGGRPAKVDRATRERIACIAWCCPRKFGRPFSTWSLSKLRDWLATSKIADISRETLRTILRAQGVSWQATKTWKGGTGPDFTEKINRVLDLYDHRPADGRVVCVDEFGPLNLQPRPVGDRRVPSMVLLCSDRQRVDPLQQGGVAPGFLRCRVEHAQQCLGGGALVRLRGDGASA